MQNWYDDPNIKHITKHLSGFTNCPELYGHNIPQSHRQGENVSFFPNQQMYPGKSKQIYRHVSTFPCN